ncbi:MAG: hypothetical protein ACFFDW_13410 [Candidatus Thorarchaeota archaeon]
MNNRNKLFISIYFSAIVLILINSTCIQGITSDWKVGDYYLMSSSDSTENHIKDLVNNIDYFVNSALKFDYQHNITSVDNISKLIYYDSQVLGSITPQIRSYDPEWFIVNRLSVNNLLNSYYNWDYNLNQSVLTSFDFSFTPLIFIEANWTSINNHFTSAVLNESNIIYSLDDPYNPSLKHNFTFGDLLHNATSFSIMGVENNLEEAKQKFTVENHQWIFEFDLTDYLKNSIYNSTSGLFDYLPFDSYKIQTECEYTEGGVLKYYLNRIQYSHTFNNRQYTTITEKILSLGGLPETEESNYAYLLILPAVFFLAISSRIIEKRKR